jgi:hypothetical protein
MPEREKPRVPLAKIRTTAAWGALTAKQAIFCERYIQSGTDRGVYDVRDAMKDAYNASSERNLKCLTYEVLANRRVREVLAIHFNQSARDLFLAELEKSISCEKGIAKIQAQKLYAKIAFGVEDSQRPEKSEEDDAVDAPQKFAIGSVIVQDEKKYIVKAEEL